MVSVSRTPGHTKHLQTIFLTKNVRLCDCPGLVFPSLVNKPLQVNILNIFLSRVLIIFTVILNPKKVLAGIYPIAQLQEPYSAIRYLSERIPVAQILKIKHPEAEREQDAKAEFKQLEWSPLDICEGNFGFFSY